jgi:hypothetical protein
MSTRTIMTAAELAEHKLTSYGRDYRFSDDGWSDMEVESKRGWEPISAWGSHGWNLGDWPYVMIYSRNRLLEPAAELPFELMSICEGDRTVYGFTTAEDRDAALDYLFLWYAAGQSWAPLAWDDRERLDRGELAVDEKFRGPYRSG